MKTVTILSGGMDSTVLAYKIHNENHEQLFLSFDYGQRHKKELEYAATTAHNLEGKGHHQIISLTDVTRFLTTSSLTGNHSVPDGHYNEDSMRSTVVPNRNAMMLSVAFSIASSIGAERVAAGVHAGDRYNYPDCRPEFLDAFQAMEERSLEGFNSPMLFAPFLFSIKAEIARLGVDNHVPFHETWSCYKGGAYHCGRCGTCVERLEALDEAGAKDTTVYEDALYWRSAVKEYERGHTK